MSGNEVLYVRSSKKNHKLNGDDTSTNDDDVWDDTLLIEAYDRAVQLAHSEVLKNMQSSVKRKDNGSKSKKKIQWKVGDKCRCEYSEDHSYYEADIIDIIDNVGMCIVKYVGYENEEKVPISKLKPSKGEIQRTLQINQALQENSVKDDEQPEKESEPESHNRSHRKKSYGKRTARNKNKETGFSANDIYFSSQKLQPPSMGVSIPPPPPPHMFTSPGDNISETEAMSAMLMAWYMSGYHTGYYQGLKTARNK